jgi:catechol 2,3-dioxygenase-like lactoylglutathione lyase family enzyme
MRALILALAAALALASCATPPNPTAQASQAPAEAEERNPLDLRRTTLIVRDMDRSLALYRDALGMTVAYDQMLTSPRLERAGGDGVNRSRLVLLRANNGFIGMLGLWQFLDGPPAEAPAAAPSFAPGEIVLLFNAEDLETRFPAVAATPGVTVISPPTPRTYPSANGNIEVIVSMLTDPDGHIVELNRLVSNGPPRQ